MTLPFSPSMIKVALHKVLNDHSLFLKYTDLINPAHVFPNVPNGDGFGIRYVFRYAKEVVKNMSDVLVYNPLEAMIKYTEGRLSQNPADDKAIAALKILEEVKAVPKAESDNLAIMEMFIQYVQCTVFSEGASKFLDSYSKGDADSVVKLAQKTVEDMQLAINTPVQVFDFSSEFDKMFLDPVAYAKTLTRCLPFGDKTIDNFLGSGFEEQTLNLFVSYPNGGKSTMAHHLVAQCVREGIHVNLTCVEDRPKSAISKLLASYTGLLRSEINEHPEKKPQHIIEEIQKARDKIKQYVVIDFIYGRSIDEIHRQKIERDRKRAEKDEPRLVVDIVDYTGHIAGMVRGDGKMYEKMREAYAKRKNFALEHNKIAFDFAQINREGAQKMLSSSRNSGLITLTDLAGSFDLTQVADNIFSINRSLSDRTSNECQIHICKGRDGPAGDTVKCLTDFAHGRFIFDVPQSEHKPLTLIQEQTLNQISEQKK